MFKKPTALIIALLLIPFPALAGDVSDHCEELASASNLNDLKASCTCFEDEISSDEGTAYLEIKTLEEWDERATDAMQAAALKCAPELAEEAEASNED